MNEDLIRNFPEHTIQRISEHHTIILTNFYLGSAIQSTFGYIDLNMVICARIRYRNKELGVELITAHSRPLFISNEVTTWGVIARYFGLCDLRECSLRADEGEIYQPTSDQLIE